MLIFSIIKELVRFVLARCAPRTRFQVELRFGYTDLQISSVIQARECIRKTNGLKFFRAAVDLIVPTNASSPVEKPLVDEAGMRPVLPSVPLTGCRVDPRSVLFLLTRCLFCMFLSSEAETPLRHSACNATLQGGVLRSGQSQGLHVSLLTIPKGSQLTETQSWQHICEKLSSAHFKSQFRF